MTVSRDDVKARLDQISHLLERHRVLESLAGRQGSEKRDLLAHMQRRENLVELERRLRGMHPADLALILASLPTTDRLIVFRQLPPRETGLTLVELDDEVRASVIGELRPDELIQAVGALDADDFAYLAPSLPDDIVTELSATFGSADRSWLVDTAAYGEGTVGRLMRQDVVALRLDQTAGEAVNQLRAGVPLPSQTDRLFLVDVRHLLRGSLPISELIRGHPDTPVADLGIAETAAFRPSDPASRAAKTFERYDLVSAPVVDDLGKLIGRITIDSVVDYMRDASDQDALTRAGLRGAEDLFAPLSESVRNRWPWLALNLVTAFAASRVIGVFEDTIARVVALATLMPIVASIGGNTGNQTVALVIRALALDQLRDTGGRLARKELLVSAVNGLTWGGVVGVLAYGIYRSASLSVVMTAAVFLNLVVAALAGVAVPFALRWAGRDPAHGASVVLTFVTDGAGFFMFLGLATVFLL
jgi:magnesium transporter